MGLKIGKNIKFRPFLVFPAFLVTTQQAGRDTVFLVVTKFLGCDTVFLVATKFLGCDSLLGRDSFWTATCFSSPTCRGHSFFVLTRIWECEYSLEISLNVECNHVEI